MKLSIHNRNLPPENSLDAFIETRLLALSDRVRIDDATVLVERLPGSSPSFRVELHIVIPGPSLRVERIDHSSLQAFTRALTDVEHKLRTRARNRPDRFTTPGPAHLRPADALSASLRTSSAHPR